MHVSGRTPALDFLTCRVTLTPMMTLQSLLSSALALSTANTVAEALERLADEGLESLPVVDASGQLAAIVSETGLLEHPDSRR